MHSQTGKALLSPYKDDSNLNKSKSLRFFLSSDEFVSQRLAPERPMLAMNSSCLNAQLSGGSDAPSLD